MSLIQLKDVYKIYAEGQENQVNALDGVTLSGGGMPGGGPMG